MDISTSHKDTLKKVISCFKKAGVDISTISGIKPSPDKVEFEIEMKNKDITVGIDYNTNDVYYQYFTSQSKIGNVRSLDKLVNTIKQGAHDHQMDVNDVDESKIKRLKEALKKAIRGQLAEESSTGTGATFNAGQGEQYATPKAFSKKGSAINRATQYLIRQGYMKMPESKRFNAKSFDIEKWK